MSINDYDKNPYLDLTNPVEYDDYAAYTMDALTRINTYRNLSNVSIKVVSPPVPVIQTGLLPKNPGELKDSPFNPLATQIMFRGRIQGDTFISAHQLLEDPCNPTKFIGDDAALAALINEHMLCISKYDNRYGDIGIGDIVTANISLGQVGPMELQFCYFDSIESVLSPEAKAAAGASIQCAGPKALFNVESPVSTYIPNPDASAYGLNTGGENDKWDSITIHSTVTTSAADAIAILKTAGNSYHYMIEKNGKAIQTVNPKYKAWHAGVKNGPASNTWSLGISLVNLAYTKSYAGTNRMSTQAQRLVEEYPELINAIPSPPYTEWLNYDGNVSKKWEPIPQAQIDGLIKVVNELKAQYPNIKTYYCHEDSALAGKEDPGPAFDAYRADFEAKTGLTQDPRFPRSTKNRPSGPLATSATGSATSTTPI